jgi:hypothetical protein
VSSRAWGTEYGRQIPDFMEHKATSSTSNDTLIALIEVKKFGIADMKAKLQMIKYMEVAATKEHRAAKLKGFLVLGAMTVVYQLQSASHDADHTILDIIPTCGEEFEKHMRDIAAEWA